MIKLKVSYKDENELKRAVIDPLKPYIIRLKKQPAKGQYKRVYIDIEKEAKKERIYFGK